MKGYIMSNVINLFTREVVKIKQETQEKEVITPKLDNYDLFITDQNPQGYSDLLIVDGCDQVVDTLCGVIFGAFKDGFGNGVYAETCGGYAGQIHGAVYNLYGESVVHISNLEPYECGCEECGEKGYEDSECEMKDWNMIQYMDNSYSDCKLYFVDLDFILDNPQHTESLTELLEFLDTHIPAQDILDIMDED